ncbi:MULTISPECIES: glutathione peroxidase [Pandoraea]|jgi:glutathione peroxidase|uniref:Glutathione peroxidase n=1 Tax=Pandoraea pnomenusa TaxID=93220 RepID=A0A378YJE4_9BURK|nr:MULTISPECIES: glutathione peroxidase [Pandoraea]AHB74970.2 glutathione peroxidase [Pandoraea pnomenusa]AHN76656.1 glutathione peroxidase [Pandoraea pnomenusa]AIU26731.1 glutathione peroxidase [Pandoraea pnomenusa]ANC43972.1 glutathione peroxidase [Pandoraea pnomenusa]MBN9093962.1 glutathione peroxidase [Pandoraea pnomenusa]
MSATSQQVYDFSVQTLSGETVSLAQYRGKVLLIVNTASECGFTPQYAGLQALYEALAPRGFEVLAFPCNQFGKQEPGDAQAIRSFCDLRFHITFPMFAKIDVKGPDAAPLYRFLTQEKPGVLGTKAIKWNFTKFLVDPRGNVVARYAPSAKPETLRADIERLLAV